MSDTSTITDAGDLRKYRTELPNLLDELGLSVYAYRLYGHLKRVCGANGGRCTEGTRTMAAKCGMSAGKVSQAKRELHMRGLITVESRNADNGESDAITIADIWPQNFAHFSIPADERSDPVQLTHTPVHDVRTPVHQVNDTRSCNEHPCSPGEQKKELVKKEPMKKEPGEGAPAAQAARPARDSRDPQLDHPAVRTYRDICHTTPNQEQRRQIVAAATDLARWAAVCRLWAGSGWNVRNVAGMLDRYQKPDATPGGTHGPHQPVTPAAAPGAGRSAKADALAELERRQRERAARAAQRL